MLAGAALAALAAPAPLTSAAAQEATWLANPVSGDFNTGANWNTGSVPLGTAFFGTSGITDLSFSADTTIGGWTFNPGAADYTFANTVIVEFSGAGIAINGGSATITNDGDLNFLNTSSAGSASITNNCCMAFYDASTAGSATITNYGDLSFNQSSTAGTATITNNNFLEFGGGSTAGRATITNNGFLTFYDTSTAGSATVANTGIVYFAGDSTAGNARITNNGLLTFDEASTAGRATNNDGITFFSGVWSGGTARLIANGIGAVDFSPLLSGGTTVGSLEGSGNFFLGSKTITVGGNNLSTEVSGVIRDGGTCCGTGGAIVKEGTGTLTLSGINTYTGPTTVDGGALVVNGSIATSSGLTVDPGALVGGVGVLPTTTINGALSPGNSIGTITVNGNLAFGAGSFYLVEVSPTAADRTNVTGAAALNGAVLASLAPGSYTARQYTILSAAGGLGGTTFASLGGIPAGFAADLSYGANDVFLNLSAALGLSSALSANERNVANAINGYFNNGGALPLNFYGLFGLTGANLANALTQLSGEAATGAQQGAGQLTNQFFSMMLDPLVYGGAGMVGGGGAGFAPGGGALRLAAEETQAPEIALAYAMALKAPPAPAVLPERRWSVWAGGFGGTNRTQGDPVGVGSHDVSARAGGYAGGLDYRIGAGRRWAWRSPAASPTGRWPTGLAAAIATPSRPRFMG